MEWRPSFRRESETHISKSKAVTKFESLLQIALKPKAKHNILLFKLLDFEFRNSLKARDVRHSAYLQAYLHRCVSGITAFRVPCC